ncbi:MAG TPA: hypothetical protein PLI74_06255 [Candidatus Kapabacteria bacterium]|nr:hypothetical protein [Ignavibacteria bacterium]HRK59224.1 hypothetical protein [Candidatus Kapabacteria bacterium]
MSRNISIEDIEHARKGLQPRTFYNELAEMGVLHDFLLRYMGTELVQDLKFRREMLDILIQYPEHLNTMSITYFLEDVCGSLSFFNEYIKPCLNNHSR